MEENKKECLVIIKDKASVQLTGVLKLDSFTHVEFLVQTELGYLHIKGENLSLGHMDMEKGTLTILGQIDSVNYVGKVKEQSKESFLKKIFK